MQLADHYHRALAEHGFSADSAQLQAVDCLERIGQELARRHAGAGPWPTFYRRFLGRGRRANPVRGAYLWGGVGRGKTFAMDLFFDCLPFETKLRYHFHRMMYRVHRRLNELGHRSDPLDIVAAELADQARVICFDEFFVSDIADAMILGRLLEALFAREVTLVATSNIPPQELYRDGLQRQKFLPAIDLIEQHTEVLQIDGGIDYRLRVLEQAEIYHSPLDDQAAQNLARYFVAIAPDTGTAGQAIEVLGRDIPTVRRADGIAWFEFDALCAGPRSQDDYIEIARTFQTVILAECPVLDEYQENEARRFISLVDEFYDRRVNLIISAAADIGELYRGRRLKREFERTMSRLREMQSHDYLAACHRA
ncbi:MAG: cell division protein ZapE [Gammaproteobacteria bacterium]|nr:cell division protein ZapE [Gammaproteobacteria bacterium]